MVPDRMDHCVPPVHIPRKRKFIDILRRRCARISKSIAEYFCPEANYKEVDKTV